MSGRIQPRHNDEFRRLFKQSGLTREQVSKWLSVSVHTVDAWMKPTTSKSAIACPKIRVDTLKVLMGLALKDLTKRQRLRVVVMLRGA